ncbi:hypothetical protein SNE40_010151 [Patella caerulea]|uniref:Protein kinase domain-containing protein n=1 Tax=Patella caerulea TaxID=87958 RepID=A0AAN8JTL7_PATCE
MNPVMHFNPNYDAVVTKCCEQILVELPRRNLKLSRLIGHGAFGEVYMGVLANVTHLTEELTVAVKTLPALCTEQTELDFLMEAVILSKFHHPNIVHLIGVCFDSIPRYIVLEILEGGDLKTFLRESRPTPTRCPDLTIRDLLCLCLDIARACHHLEEKHFIHRDIAARNCLLTSKGPSRKAKIADFGMARDIYRSDYYKKTGRALLPVKWMPPEAFLDGIFTAKTDIWSYGILLWEIFSLGHMPYPGCSNEEVMQSVTVGGRLTPPDGCPATVYEIMNYCWSGLAEERPTFTTLVSSVEKCLEDDDVVSRGLPAFYQPAVPGTQGLRLPSNPMSTSISTTRVRECLDASSNYLEPLIPASSLSSNQLNNLDGSFEFSPNA